MVETRATRDLDPTHLCFHSPLIRRPGSDQWRRSIILPEIRSTLPLETFSLFFRSIASRFFCPVETLRRLRHRISKNLEYNKISQVQKRTRRNKFERFWHPASISSCLLKIEHTVFRRVRRIKDPSCGFCVLDDTLLRRWQARVNTRLFITLSHNTTWRQILNNATLQHNTHLGIGSNNEVEKKLRKNSDSILGEARKRIFRYYYYYWFQIGCE